MIIDWNQLEREWVQAITDAIDVTAESNPGERFYAGAIWLLYGDYASIRVPVFGLNGENSSADVRWHPPDWRWSIVDAAHERVQPLYESLGALQVDEETYRRLWNEHLDMLARVCRRVTRTVRAHEMPVDDAAFAPGFFVGIIDFSQGEDAIDYLKRSVDEETLIASGILEQGT